MKRIYPWQPVHLLEVVYLLLQTETVPYFLVQHVRVAEIDGVPTEALDAAGDGVVSVAIHSNM